MTWHFLGNQLSWIRTKAYEVRHASCEMRGWPSTIETWSPPRVWCLQWAWDIQKKRMVLQRLHFLKSVWANPHLTVYVIFLTPHGGTHCFVRPWYNARACGQIINPSSDELKSLEMFCWPNDHNGHGFRHLMNLRSLDMSSSNQTAITLSTSDKFAIFRFISLSINTNRQCLQPFSVLEGV